MPKRNFFQDRDLFLQLLEIELRRSLRYQSFTSVLLIEIPRARETDPQGANTLFEKVAASLGSQIRETDLIGSTKENMITVILLNCDTRCTGEVANRVGAWVLHYFGSAHDDRPSNLRLGVGVACFPTHATDLEHLLTTASESLDISKRQLATQIEFEV